MILQSGITSNLSASRRGDRGETSQPTLQNLGKLSKLQMPDIEESGGQKKAR